MFKNFSALVLLLCLSHAQASETAAPKVDLSKPTYSVGQPHLTQFNISGTLGRYDGSFGGSFTVEVSKNLMLPQYRALNGNLGLTLLKSGLLTDVRPSVMVGTSFLRGGLEYSVSDKKLRGKLSLNPFYSRRGGPFGSKTSFKIDISHNYLGVGLEFFDLFGKQRLIHNPKTIDVPKAPAPIIYAAASSLGRESEDLLKRIKEEIKWIDLMTTPDFRPGRGKDQDVAWERTVLKMNELAAHVAQPDHTFESEVRNYHLNLGKLFVGIAGSEKAGQDLARITRQAIMYDLIVPINRDYGQQFKTLDFQGYIYQAHRRFASQANELMLTPTARSRASGAFLNLLRDLTEVIKEGQSRWDANLKNVKTVWIPIQLGITPENLDTQEKMDKVIAAVVGSPFELNRNVDYIHNSRFIDVLVNMILETKYYHVLVIHDVKGLTEEGKPDRISWDTMVTGYMESFITAIHEMDLGKRKDLPQYMIFLDQFYYHGNKAKDIMSFAEKIHEFQKPIGLVGELLAKVEKQQQRLQKAVDESPALKALGKDYIKNNLKIHVNITNIYDGGNPAYATLMDHRKFAFADVFEDDPNSGKGLVTGEGVGEEYLGVGWEDRALYFQGPTAVGMKTATRDLFVRLGRKNAEKLPDALRERPAPAELQTPVGWSTKLQFANTQTSYGKKEGTVVKAALYSLMPKGSMMIAPDSIWTSDIWAAMFVGAALRGCHVYPIAPAIDNAAARGAIIFAGTIQASKMMFLASKIFAKPIAAAGGTLNVGFYAIKDDVENLKKRVVDIQIPVMQPPYFDKQFIFTDETRTKVSYILADFVKIYQGPNHVTDSKFFEVPRLHMKDQFFVSAEAQKIFASPEWPEVVKEYLDSRRMQTVYHRSFKQNISAKIFEPLRSSLDKKALMYLSVGSHNQDGRSMFLNGETTVTVAGFDSLVGALDFYFLLKKASWPQTEEELYKFIPMQDPKSNFLSRILRDQI